MITRKSRIIETYSLLFMDLFAVILAFTFSYVIRYFSESDSYIDTYYLAGAVVLIASAIYGNLSSYNRDFFRRGYFVELLAILKYDLVLLVSLATFVFISQEKQFSRMVFVLFGAFLFVFTYVFHIIFKKYMLSVYRHSDNSDKVLVITESGLIEELIEDMKDSKSWNYVVTSIAYVDREKKPLGEEMVFGIPVMAGRKDLFEISTVIPLDVVFLYLPNTPVLEIKEIIEKFETMGLIVHYNVERKELNLEGKTAGRFAGFTVMTFSLTYLDYRRVLIKRFFDIIGGIVGLLITALFTPFVALAIKIESKGPVFFKQERVGKNGRRFTLYKFRSMYVDADEKKKELMDQNEMDGLMFKMKNDPRVTKVGKFIRKTSIDELPQFYNILMGNMSLVGTRPPTVDEFEKYDAYYRRRLSITPGLTGMWQVSGRSDIENFDDVVRLDLEYIENWSLSLDVKILLQTIGVVLFRKGAK